MAQKATFPMLPGAHWWALRKKFKQSIPGVVTESYLAAALNVQVSSARANILPYLKDIGLINKENKTQELAKAWRDDDQYANVCKQIREKIYPEDLRTAAPDSTKDRSTIERWFARHTGAGTSAIRRMTQFYVILLEADVKKKKETREIKSKETKKQPKEEKLARPEKKVISKAPGPKVPQSQFTPHSGDVSSVLPGISINLQIHISADATPDQIDKIFESMAKHIYNK